MSGYVPRLDDVTFDELVEEAQRLIPEIAPDWTDHNLHDPGITVIELLSWLVDQQVYRIGFVGPSLRRAFARLMGIDARPAKQATFDIWPMIGVQVPALDLTDGFVLQSEDIPDGKFYLDGDTRLTQARIEKLFLVSGTESRKELGLGLLEGRSHLTLDPSQSNASRSLELELSGLLAAPGHAGPLSLGLMITGAPKNAAEKGDWGPLRVEEKDPGGGWRQLSVEDRTHGLARSGIIRFSPQTTGGIASIRIRLEQGFRPDSVTLTRLGLNVLPALEGERVRSGVVGRGNGNPDQTFEFTTDDIVGGRTAVEFTGPDAVSGSSRVWKQVEDLESAGPTDAHLIVDTDENLVTLGNGLNGSKLLVGGQLLHGEFVRTTGADGNIAKGLRWSLQGDEFGENLEAGSGGRSAERLDDVVNRARAAASVRNGGITAADLEHRLDCVGLGLARTVVHPRRRPGSLANGSRTVVIIPEREPDAFPGTPQSELMEAVGAALEPARLLGERLYISPPIYVEVDIDLTITVLRDADVSSIRERVVSLIRGRVWDLKRHADVEPWFPGQPIGSGDIRALLTHIPDALRLDSCTIEADDGRALDEGGRLILNDRECPMVRRAKVSVLRDEGALS